MIYRVRGDNVRLVKFRSNNKLEIVIACFLFVIIIFISLMFYFKSYAVFREEKHFNVINGEVQDPGDIYFAYYVDNEITRSMPSYESGYTLDTTKSTCTNGVTVGWDSNLWAAVVYYKNYKPENMTRTKCNLYFTNSLVDYIKNISKNDITNLATDDYENVRYIGSNPNNYVSVDGELWRIIGVMKNVDDGTGSKSDRVKLIRDESIGNYSWDTSESSVNGGYGVNEWSGADIMKLLNPGYESESIGGSLYWNKKVGMCYSSENMVTKSCDFTNTGLKSNLKSLIDNALWNTGTNGTNDWTSASKGLVGHFYTYERSNDNGKICISGDYCNDTVERTTKWVGKVGLMYISDYGYATSGGSPVYRTTCLNKELYNWNDDNIRNCRDNDWLYNAGVQSTLSIGVGSIGAANLFSVFSDGRVFNNHTSDALIIRPVVYLKPTVKIISGIGTKENPFVIEN